MPMLRHVPLLGAALALALFASGCGGDGGSGTSAATTKAPATVTTGPTDDSDARLAFVTAANDLGDYCLAKLHGESTKVDPADAIDRMLAGYRSLGENAELRQTLQRLSRTLGTCYQDGADRLKAALG